MSAARTDEQIGQLKAAIASLEAQRPVLGIAAVEIAVAALRQQLADLRQVASPPPALDGEYKRVTVMFADLSGFTALAERLGPERIRRLMNDCFEALVPVVEKYEGVVEKFVGDAIMAVFGAPVTHENDPERALRAALEMQEVLAVFNRAQGMDLGLHFGINTGLVVAGGIGSAGRQEYSVMGDPVNVAARLEDASERGEILVGPDTYRLTQPLFEFERLPLLRVKGRSEPVAAYRLIGLKAAPGAVRGIEGLRSPLVGRNRELRQLQDLFRSLQQGHGGRAAVVAEAGQGKSRLVTESRQSLSGSVTWAEGRALSYTENISYWIARDLLRSWLGATVDSSSAEMEAALRCTVERLFPDQTAEAYPYLARLLELPLDAAMQERVQYLSAEALQQQMLRAVSEYVLARAREQPLVLVWEDLHWADPSSLHLLETLLPLPDEVPLLLLFVFRPQEGRVQSFHQQARTTYGERYQVIELAPLTRKQSKRLLHNLLQIENLPEATRQLILDKAEGNAFFLEEVLRSLIDAGLVVLQGDRAISTGAIGDLHVPDTLQGVIMARIDRLRPEDKRTLQTASVIGRVFQQRVLQYLMQSEAAVKSIDPSLSELQRRELIRQRMSAGAPGAGMPLDQEFIFKHVLTQDVTYNSLLAVRRQELHGVTGEAMEALFPDHLEELSASLGYHFERAEVHDKAVHYLTLAGDRARSVYANIEAITLYRTAIDQASRLLSAEGPPAETWREATGRLHESLGDLLELTGQHEEARSTYQEALALVPPSGRTWQSRLYRRIGDTWMPQLGYNEALRAYARAEAVLGENAAEPSREWWQEWINIQLDRISVHYRKAEVAEMERLIEKVRPVVEPYGAPRQRGDFLQRITLMSITRDRWSISDQTLSAAQEMLAAYAEAGDPVEVANRRGALGAFQMFRGELDQAEEHLKAALTLVERMGDVAQQTFLLNFRTMLARKRGQVEEVRHYSERCRTAAEQAQRPLYTAMAQGHLAWLAWRGKDLSAAERIARAALELIPTTYWFRWVAVWPLLGVAVVQDRVSEAVEHAKALLAPPQQLPPEALIRLLETGIQAWESGQPEIARAHLEQAMGLAREMGYL